MIVIVTSAFGSLEVPVIVGVVSFVLSGASTLIVGDVVSILPGSVAVALLPALSDTEASAV